MLLPIVFALVRCLVALADGSFQVQPQPVRINNQEEIYITEEDNYIGQVLYRFDQLQLECECQMHADQSHYHLYWTVNNQLVHAHNDSKRMQLAVDRHTVQEPITYVTCHCLFNQANSKEIVRDYRYKLYIGREALRRGGRVVQCSTCRSSQRTVVATD